MENNWQFKTLENLEKKISNSIKTGDDSYLITTCNRLCKKQLKDFTTEDLRIMIGQEIGLNFLIPLALETLTDDLFAEGDYYEGDLLKNVLEIKTEFWNSNKKYWKILNDLIKNRRNEIEEKKISTINFDNCSFSAL